MRTFAGRGVGLLTALVVGWLAVAPRPCAAAEPVAVQAKDESKRPSAMFIAGIVVTATAVVAGAVFVAGMVELRASNRAYRQGPTLEDRQEADRVGQQGETLALAGGISCLGLLAIGIPLLIVGRGGKESHERQVRLLPSFARDGAALSLRARF